MKKAFFIHIPKTAGTSINTLLSFQYGHKKNYWHTTQESWVIAKMRLAQHMSHSHGECCLIRGHIPYGWHDLCGEEYTYFSILRDPLSRAISQYEFAKNHGRGIWYDELKPFQSLEAYLYGAREIGHANYQLHYLSGIPIGEALTSDDLDAVIHKISCSEIIVGTLDRMECSLLLLSAVLQWRKPIFNLRYNLGKSGKSHAITADAEAHFRKENSLDYALYEYVNKNLNEAIAKQGQAYRIRAKLYQYYGPLFANIAHYGGALYRKLISNKG